jgi:DNA-binding transcriptional LysR family regulator
MNPKDLDSRHLRHVIAVAEEGNLVRAAKKRLFLSEGSLTRDIRELQERLGFKLFSRHRRGVSLTPAGAVFVEEARKAIAHLERAIHRGLAASQGEIGMMLIGYCPFIEAERLMEVRERFTELLLDASIVFLNRYSSEQVEMVLAERIAAGLVVFPLEADELESKEFWKERLCAALPGNSPLASTPTLSLNELSNQPAVWLAKSLNPRFHDKLLDDCHRLGYGPKIVHEVLTYDELLGVIGTGVGVGLVTESMSQRVQARGVVFRPLPEPGLFVHTGAIYRADNSSKSLLALLAVLSESGNLAGDESSTQIKPG